MVGIIGRSGAGKSTLLRLVNRLAEPSAGRILADGIDVATLTGAALRRSRRDCAMIFQQFDLVPRLDVLANVMLGGLQRRSRLDNLLGRFTRDERLAVLAALERLGIAETAPQLAGTLSGGQQQPAALGPDPAAGRLAEHAAVLEAAAVAGAATQGRARAAA